MPWLAKTVSEARREFVTLANAPGANIRALCRQFGVAPIQPISSWPGIEAAANKRCWTCRGGRIVVLWRRRRP